MYIYILERKGTPVKILNATLSSLKSKSTRHSTLNRQLMCCEHCLLVQSASCYLVLLSICFSPLFLVTYMDWRLFGTGTFSPPSISVQYLTELLIGH